MQQTAMELAVGVGLGVGEGETSYVSPWYKSFDIVTSSILKGANKNSAAPIAHVDLMTAFSMHKIASSIYPFSIWTTNP